MAVTEKEILFMLAKEFGLGRETVERRLMLQKTVYLLQAFGMNLGYGYSWYRYGPYSQDLVSDSYQVLHSEKLRYAEKTQNYRFSKDTQKQFELFRKAFSSSIGDPRKLELLASVHFILSTWHPDANESTIPGIFHQYKKTFYDGTSISKELIKNAFQECKQVLS
jgi:uncharacterized protein YwgA